MGSIKTQLLLWLLIPLIMIGFFALIDGYYEARTTADEVSDRVLAGSVLAIAERVFVNDEGDLEVDIPYVALQMLTSSEDDRVFYRIEDSDGAFITGYRKLELPLIGTQPQEVGFDNSIFRGAEIRVAVMRSFASSNTKSLGYVVAVAETTNARAVIAQELLIRTGIRITSLICAAALFVWIAVSRSFQPLKRLEEAVARRSPEDVRPIEHKVPDEVNGLVITINGLVSRFASSIMALRKFTSNASHQFRTPLAIIRTHLEIASRENSPEAKAKAILDAQTAVDDAERMVTQMLTLARIDASTRSEISFKISDLSKITRKVCEDSVLHLSNRNRSDVDLGYSDEGSLNIQGEETLIQEVVRNLLDNAIKHGGQNLKIDVSVRREDDRALLEIYDSGHAFELPSEQKLKQVAIGNIDRIGSNGFGLAVVSEILDIYDARIDVHQQAGNKGKTVVVSFKSIAQQSSI